MIILGKIGGPVFLWDSWRLVFLFESCLCPSWWVKLIEATAGGNHAELRQIESTSNGYGGNGQWIIDRPNGAYDPARIDRSSNRIDQRAHFVALMKSTRGEGDPTIFHAPPSSQFILSSLWFYFRSLPVIGTSEPEVHWQVLRLLHQQGIMSWCILAHCPYTPSTIHSIF